jgi:hypothetical protein
MMMILSLAFPEVMMNSKGSLDGALFSGWRFQSPFESRKEESEIFLRRWILKWYRRGKFQISI